MLTYFIHRPSPKFLEVPALSAHTQEAMSRVCLELYSVFNHGIWGCPDDLFWSSSGNAVRIFL